MKVLDQLEEARREHWEKKSEQIRQKNIEDPKRKNKKTKGWNQMIHTGGGATDVQGKIFDRKIYLLDEQEQLIEDIQRKKEQKSDK